MLRRPVLVVVVVVAVVVAVGGEPGLIISNSDS